MDAVLLFSGQGAQKVGMGKDLYDQYPVAKALIEQADKALGESLSAVMFEGPGEELNAYLQLSARPLRTWPCLPGRLEGARSLPESRGCRRPFPGEIHGSCRCRDLFF